MYATTFTYLLSDGEYLAIAWSINLLLCLNVFLVVCCAVCVIPSCASSFFLYLYVTLIVAVLWWGVCRALLGALVDCSLVSSETHPFKVLVYYNKFFMAVQCYVSFPIPYLFLYCSLYCLLLMSSSFFSPITVLFSVLLFCVWVPSRRCREFVLFVPLYHLKFLYLALTPPCLFYCPEPTTLGTCNTSSCLLGIVRSLCCLLVCVAWPIIHPFRSLVSCDTYCVDIQGELL